MVEYLGYSVGGKTGTSEPPVGKEEEGYVASYVAISPVEDSQIVLLVTLYNPTGKNGHHGSQVAGPAVSQILSEILPYLGVASNDTSSSDTNPVNSIVVPDIRNKTVAEADKILKASGFNTKIYVNGDANNILVEDQTPKPGNSLSKDSIIVLYGQGSSVSTSVAVPNLEGMNASQATSALRAKNLNIITEGSGYVVSQDYYKDEQVQEGTIIRVTLKPTITSE